jgi:hypothetical protein
LNVSQEIVLEFWAILDLALVITKSFTWSNFKVVQVMKMAKEIRKLHCIHEVQRHQANEESLRLQSQAIAATVESQCKQAKADRLKLQQVKEQLHLLELQEHQPVTKIIGSSITNTDH